MQWNRSGLIASWEFSEEHVEKVNGSDPTLVEKHREKKWGVMVIIKSLHFLTTAISAGLKEASHASFPESDLEDTISGQRPQASNQGNMLHVALVGINNQMSSLQDRCVCVLPIDLAKNH